MVDYWINHQFTENKDYYIHEKPEDSYISQIEWDYSITDYNNFNVHPDFNDEITFTIQYSALEWEIFNEEYIKDGEDQFTFQPKEYYNVSILYTGDINSDVFSLQYIVPKGQYKEDYITFKYIYAFVQVDDDEETIMQFCIFNGESDNFLLQNAPDSYYYTINFDEINIFLQNTYGQEYRLVENSYLYIKANYYSISLQYPLSHTPFNYDYLSEEHDDYHLALYIDDVFIAYSNDSIFEDYVLKIEDNLIYFKNNSEGQPEYILPVVRFDLNINLNFNLDYLIESIS